MKTTGIVRHVDELGRIVIPKEMRRVLGISNGDPVEINLVENRIEITKYSRACNLCGSSDSVIATEFMGKIICQSCLEALKDSV